MEESHKTSTRIDLLGQQPKSFHGNNRPLTTSVLPNTFASKVTPKILTTITTTFKSRALQGSRYDET
jgi:hypothetical protein